MGDSFVGIVFVSCFKSIAVIRLNRMGRVLQRFNLCVFDGVLRSNSVSKFAPKDDDFLHKNSIRLIMFRSFLCSVSFFVAIFSNKLLWSSLDCLFFSSMMVID